MSTLLRFSHVSKNYEAHRVLKRVSFELGEGELIWILGENGSGKSTILSLAAKLMKPDKGEVFHDSSLRLGWLGHASQLYLELSGRENLAFFGELWGVDDLHARLSELSQSFSLEPFWERRVRTYSRGQLQRVLLARTLLHKPNVLLFDEPTSGLDRQGVALLESLMKDQLDKKTSMLVVTHDQLFFSQFQNMGQTFFLSKGSLTKKHTRGNEVHDNVPLSE